MLHPRPSLSTQHGTAIIVALFVMALVAAAATAMMARLGIDTHRTERLLNANQAYLYAEGSVAWARDVLANNISNAKPRQLTDKMPVTSKQDNTAGFLIQSTIYDAQGLFNINNVSVKDNLPDLLTLLKVISPDLATDTATKITQATQQWMTLLSGNNRDTENAYAKQQPPYSIPHRLMASCSELRLVQGVTAGLYAALLPYMIALPDVTPVNINTASIPVLMSLNSHLTIEAAKTIDQYRTQHPFTDISALQEVDALKSNPLPATKITLTSNYFLVKTSVKVGQQQTILYTLLKRTVEKNKPSVTVLWQTKGTL